MSRAAAFLSLSIALAIVTAPSAGAAGGAPVPPDGIDSASVVAPDGEGPRYSAVTLGDRTEVIQIDQDGGEVTQTQTIDGRFTIPLVAMDGTPAGLSADRDTLVLISPRRSFRFPRRETSFVIVDIRGNGVMRPQPPLTLRGDFSFDALSPDGRTMYLVEYLSRDYNDYAVREYDLRRERLLADPVLVAHEVSPGEMRGMPMTRATSPDGRWEYTLYNGGGQRSDEAFIHTLDTEQGVSHCVDLTMVNGNEAWRVGLELSDEGGTLSATRGDRTLASLDTETFAVTEPLASELTESSSDSGGGVSGLAVGALAVGTVLAIGTALGLRRRRHDGSLPAESPSSP